MFDLIPFEHRNNDLFRFFDDFDRNFFRGFEESSAPCRTDILDKGDHYELHAEMPGSRKEDIHIDLDGDRLTTSAEHKEETEEKGSYLRRERRWGALSRSFDISAVAAARISAAYENGVLKLNLPNKTEAAPASHRIEIQ